MELSTLKIYRIIIPGVTILVFSLPVLFFSTPIDQYVSKTWGDNAVTKYVVLILIFGLGAIFDILNIRRIYIKTSHKRIIENINDKLLENGLAREVTDEKRAKVKATGRLLQVFYYFVDNDSSLKEKSKLVRVNGLMWTSTADVLLIAIPFFIIYILLMAVFGMDNILLGWTILISLLGLLSALKLHPNAIAKHIELSDTQLEYIVIHKKQELQEKVNTLFD